MVGEISIWVCVYFFCPPYSSLLECVPFVCLTLIPYQFVQIYGIFSSGNWLTMFITVVCSFPPHTHSADLLFLSAGHFSATCSDHPMLNQMKRFLIIRYHPLKADSLSSSFTVKWLQWHHKLAYTWRTGQRGIICVNATTFISNESLFSAASTSRVKDGFIFPINAH